MSRLKTVAKVAGVVAAAATLQGCQIIDQTEVGHLKFMGKIGENPRYPGLNFWGGPTVPTTYRSFDAKTETYSFDEQEVKFDLTFTYCVPKTMARDLLVNYDLKAERALQGIEMRIKANLGKRSEVVVGKISARSIIPNRLKVGEDFTAEMKRWIKEQGLPIEIVEVIISNVHFTKEYEKAIEQKMMAEQDLERAGTERKTEMVKGMTTSDRAMEFIEGMGYPIKNVDVKCDSGNVITTRKILDARGMSPEQAATARRQMMDLVKYTDWKPTNIVGGEHPALSR